MLPGEKNRYETACKNSQSVCTTVQGLIGTRILHDQLSLVSFMHDLVICW